jgi:transcriptional regulator with XRE-family HTH domain
VAKTPDESILARRRAFGERLVQLRKDKGWSQEKLAHASDVDRTFIAEVETGKVSMGFDRMALVADALQVPIAALFDAPDLTEGHGI